MNCYKVTLRVVNEVGVLARVTIFLRKHQINIMSLNVEPILENEKNSIMSMVITSEKDEWQFIKVVRKLERLIPIIDVSFELC